MCLLHICGCECYRHPFDPPPQSSEGLGADYWGFSTKTAQCLKKKLFVSRGVLFQVRRFNLIQSWVTDPWRFIRRWNTAKRLLTLWQQFKTQLFCLLSEQSQVNSGNMLHFLCQSLVCQRLRCIRAAFIEVNEEADASGRCTSSLEGDTALKAKLRGWKSSVNIKCYWLYDRDAVNSSAHTRM